MSGDGCGSQYLNLEFDGEKNVAKVKTSIFIRPKIRELMPDSKYRGKRK